MRGDINAVELHQDKEFLTRLGYGIFDVAVGSTGDVGFEDVRRYSYLEAEEEDPKLYRRRVFNLVGKYYPNDLAQVLWAKFKEYQVQKAWYEGRDMSLEQAAREWLTKFGHSYFKEWTLHMPEVPTRMRNQEDEPRLGWLDVAALNLFPQWRELFEAGFSLTAILFAELRRGRAKNGKTSERYLRLVAALSGHRIHNAEEARKRMAEVEELEKYLVQHGQELNPRAATIEYYRRLNFIAAIEN